MSLSLLDFEVEAIKPGIYVGKVNDEEVRVRIFVIPIHVIKRENEYSVMFNTVVVADSNKIKAGEVCNPQNISIHRGRVLEDMRIINKPETIVRVENNKKIRISLEVTNIVIYPELRDPSGSPCVTVSWIYFQTVE